MEFHLTAMECRLLYGITQCYLPPETSDTTPHLNPSQIGRYSIYLPQRDGRLSWPRWLVTYWDGLPARRQTVTHPSTNRAQCRLTTLIEAKVLTAAKIPLELPGADQGGTDQGGDWWTTPTPTGNDTETAQYTCAAQRIVWESVYLSAIIRLCLSLRSGFSITT